LNVFYYLVTDWTTANQSETAVTSKLQYFYTISVSVSRNETCERFSEPSSSWRKGYIWQQQIKLTPSAMRPMTCSQMSGLHRR